MKASEMYRKAGDELRRHGWCQGWFFSEEGARCAIGACNSAIDGRPGGHAAVDADNLEALEVIAGDDIGITHWNDMPDRTPADVMHALDAAYVLALQEEGIEPEDVL